MPVGAVVPKRPPNVLRYSARRTVERPKGRGCKGLRRQAERAPRKRACRPKPPAEQVQVSSKQTTRPITCYIPLPTLTWSMFPALQCSPLFPWRLGRVSSWADEQLREIDVYVLKSGTPLSDTLVTALSLSAAGGPQEVSCSVASVRSPQPAPLHLPPSRRGGERTDGWGPTIIACDCAWADSWTSIPVGHIMSDVPPSRKTWQCPVCGDRGHFNVGALRCHQLTQHRGAAFPSSSEREPSPPPNSSAAVCDGRRDGGGGVDGAGGPQGDGCQPVSDPLEVGVAALLECTRQAAPLPVRASKRGRSGKSSRRAQEVTYPSVATHVLGVYDAYDDASRVVPLAIIAQHSNAGQLQSRRLRAFQSFVCNAGGSGLTNGDIDHLWHLFHE